ncbi:MAG: ABC transporter ATP-binding protein [Clostridiales bacterium]|jgi:iron complex transport system ATP-binding protein|nr:ABC transporter ATP-binding protein [Clostridiales bacterium]
MLDVIDLTVTLGNAPIVQKLSFSLTAGDWLMVVGPNGAGKSTLLNAIVNTVPFEGQILLGGKSIRAYKPNELARNIGFLAQRNQMLYAYTVEDVVRLGRYAYSGGFFKRNEEDELRIDEAFELTGTRALKHKNVMTLSGGETQRMFLAQTLAQNPRLLLLDEPTNYLDLIYQKKTFELINEWVKTRNRGVISVMHDLGLARKFGQKILLMNGGKCVAFGDPAEVFVPEILTEVYKMDVTKWMRGLLVDW